MVPDLSSICEQAVSLLKSIPKDTRIRVVSHYDADGISAAGLLCHALNYEGYPFHASLMRNPFDRGFTRLAAEKNACIIFSDMGSGQIEMVEQLKTKCIILDHHQYLRDSDSSDIVQINANKVGIDGNYEASGATISYAFITTLNQENTKLAPLALVGAIGDKQHIGGLKGHNQTILKEAIDLSLLTPRIGSKLYGNTIQDALYYSIDPYIKSISGNTNEITKVLQKLKIDPTQKPNEISPKKQQTLNSILLLRLLNAKVPPDIIDIAFRTRYYAPSLNCELERLADLFDACGKNGYRSLGLSISLGNHTDIQEAEQIELDYKTKILTSLQALEQNQYHTTNSYDYFYSDSSSLGGVVAGIGINYVLGGQKPLIALAKKDQELHISCRGTQSLVRQGLDLGSAMKTVSTSIGGYGGGHKIAAGATIPLTEEKRFIKEVDSIITTQLKASQ